MRTSYSSIETYNQCPQKYKFQEIDRIRVSRSKEAIFGTLVHDSLKFMFQKDPLFPTPDEVINYFRGKWPGTDVFSSDSESSIFLQEGIKMLKNFYQKNSPWNFSVIDLESHFEAPIEAKNGAVHILAGKIDRIDKVSDGEYEIIDYKTGKRMPSQDNLNNDLQLSLYSFALQKRWPHLKPDGIKLSLYFLKHGEKLSAVSSKETTEKAQNHVLKTISDIEEKLRKNDTFEPTPGPLCDWCGYKPMCPAWRHLYQKPNDKLQKIKDEIDATVKEYFEIKTISQKNDARLAELQAQIKDYMEREGLTRIFGDDGYISKRNQQRYEYNFDKIKLILAPLGKWEEILKADERKLLKVMREIPEEERIAIENLRAVSKEFITLTVSMKKFKNSNGSTDDEDDN